MADQMIETCWRVVGSSGYEYRCGIYRDTELLDVRVSLSRPGNERRVFSELVGDVAGARKLANEWLRKVLRLEAFRQRS